MNARNIRVAFGLLAGVLYSGSACVAASAPAKLMGSIVGYVSDSSGVPQMGATVLLFNRHDRLLQRALTNDKGAFGFDTLTPDVYSLRVTMASFMPAMKNRLVVQPGTRSFLAINLANVLSSIELVYSAPGQASLMNDDWKWVLRGSSATRPVLRFQGHTIDISDPSNTKRTQSAVAGDTRGVVRLSAGDQGPNAPAGNAPDLGTSFALATSVFGGNQVQVSGNVGYASESGRPTAGFRTTFSRQDPGMAMPEVQLTMRQVFLPSRAGLGAIAGNGRGAPMLQTMSLALHNGMQVSEDLHLEYGFNLESISFLERLNYASPYMRATYDLGNESSLQFAYSSGAPPLELMMSSRDSELDLQQDLSTLAVFPRLSLRDGRPRMQRADNLEVGYKRSFGSRTLNVGIYSEKVRNAALMAAAPAGLYSSQDLLPDFFSDSSVFNIGEYQGFGYTASLTQAVNEHLSFTLSYGRGTALRTDARELPAGSPDELRAMVRSTNRDWASGHVSARVPWSGTRFVSSYQWTDYRSLTPGHTFITQGTYPEAGLNVYMRQPIPLIGGLPGRLEATAEMRNMMAQGYLPLTTSDGRRMYLIHSPRSVRGGLSFIF